MSTNCVLMSVTFGQRAMNQIELTLTRESERYIVAVNDSEGPLHLVEFRYTGILDMLKANEEALSWFDDVHEAIDKYIEQSGSQAIRNLVETLN